MGGLVVAGGLPARVFEAALNQANYGAGDRVEYGSAGASWQERLVNLDHEIVFATAGSVGPIDGVLGAQTISAVSEFAKSKGIPHGANYVPVEVLQALDLEI